MAKPKILAGFPLLPSRWRCGASAPASDGVDDAGSRSHSRSAHGLPERRRTSEPEKARRKLHKNPPPGTEKPAAHGVAANGTKPIAKAKAKAKINSLPDGPRVDHVREPDRSMDELQPEDLREMGVALGVVEPGRGGEVTKAQRDVMRQILADFQNELDNGMSAYDNAFLDELNPRSTAENPAPQAESTGSPLPDPNGSQARPLAETSALITEEPRDPVVPRSPLSAGEFDELRGLMDKVHMKIHAERDAATGLQNLKVFFDGSEKSRRDVGHDLASTLGMTGRHDKSARRLGELFSKVLDQPDFASLKCVSGLSMGGGTAQTFLATLQDTMETKPPRPAMILLDPLLHNNRQARFATERGEPYTGKVARAVVFTLNYAGNPKHGVVDKLKKYLGYRTAGLVHVALGLKDTDGAMAPVPLSDGIGVRFETTDVGGGRRLPPEPSRIGLYSLEGTDRHVIPLGNLGYHDNMAQYAAALGRFAAAGPKGPGGGSDLGVPPKRTRTVVRDPLEIDLDDSSSQMHRSSSGGEEAVPVPTPLEIAPESTSPGFDFERLFRGDPGPSLADTLRVPPSLVTASGALPPGAREDEPSPPAGP